MLWRGLGKGADGHGTQLDRNGQGEPLKTWRRTRKEETFRKCPWSSGVLVVKRQGIWSLRQACLRQRERERENRKEGKGVGGRVVGKAKRMGLSI